VDINSLCHSSWDCKHHIGWIPKCRRKVMYVKIRENFGACSYHVSTVGKDEEKVEGYIKNQEGEILPIVRSAKTIENRKLLCS
jgi:putative transposase